MDMYATDMKEIKKALEYLLISSKNKEESSVSNTQASENAPETVTHPIEEISGDSMVLNIRRKDVKDVNDVATTKCQIHNLLIPKAVLDTGANCSIMSKNLAKKLKLSIDTTNPTSIEGVATEADTIGWVYQVPVSVGSVTIIEDFLIVDDDKPALLLGTPWITRARMILDLNNRSLFIPNSENLFFRSEVSVQTNKKKKS